MANVWSSAKILEFDFAGIEQVLMGWFFRSPQYILTAKLGTHAIVASNVLAREKGSSWVPADLSWPQGQIADYLKSIKKSKDEHVDLIYNQSKRCVHGTAYGLTTYGMCRNYPETFKTQKSAEEIQQIYFDLAPEVPQFHTVVRHTAYTQRFIGGPPPYDYNPDTLTVSGHPYGYKHWFWSVVSYRRLNPAQVLWHKKRKIPTIEFNGIHYVVQLGEDAKRCVAFYPQGTARGVLTEACFPLFDPEDPMADRCYIGDVYYGQTPLRAPIHDSLLLEVPTRKVDQVIERCALAMQRPMVDLPCPAEWGLGPALTIGVDAKMGPDWGSMAPINVPSLQDLGVANDTIYTPADVDEEDDVLDLEVRLSA
jgi:hypothetical protein